MVKEIIPCSPTDKRTGCFNRIANNTENDHTWADLQAAKVFFNLPDLLPVEDSEDTRPIVAIERTTSHFRRELERCGPKKMARLLTEPHEHTGKHGDDYAHNRGHEDRVHTERMETIFGVDGDFLLLYGVDDETEPYDGSVVLHTSALMPKPAEHRDDYREPLVVSLSDIGKFAHQEGATIELNPDLGPSDAGLSFVVRGITPKDLQAAEIGGVPIELNQKRKYTIDRALARRAELAAQAEKEAAAAEQAAQGGNDDEGYEEDRAA